jgi:hypothetical protein
MSLEIILSFFFGFDAPKPPPQPAAKGPTLEGPPGLADEWLPCEPGLAITYQVTVDGQPRSKVVEEVKGRGSEPRLCVVDRRVAFEDGTKESGAIAREHLDDRISNAGWADLPSAFRPPMIKAPIEVGKKWHFNRADYEIVEVGKRLTLAAGTFETLHVRERATDGNPHVADNWYARGVGLVLRERAAERMEAVAVSR